MADLEALALTVRSAAKTAEISGVNRERLVQYLEKMRQSRVAVRAARQPAPNDEASEAVDTALLQDMETLYGYVRFLTEVLEHIPPTKD